MRIAVQVLCALTLCACQTLPALQPVRPVSDVTVELSDVPFFSDDTTLCGPSALAAVLLHAGIPVTFEELGRDVYLPGRQGSLQLEMLTAVRRRGALAMPVNGGLQAVEQALQAGFPTLVLMNLGLSFAPSWHYAVVVGIQTDHKGAQTVVLRSGTQHRQLMTAGVFERVWARSARWGFVVGTAQRLPTWMPSAQVLDGILALGTAVDPLMSINLLNAAQRHWPTDQRIAFALASQLQMAGQVEKAQAVWLDLAARGGQPAAAANLANLLMSRGDTDQAARWACEALRDLASEPLSASVRQRIAEEAVRIRQQAGKPACEAAGQAQAN